MITFVDRRDYIEFSERLDIVIIHDKPLGEFNVIINEDWYKNPVIPYPSLNLTDVFGDVLGSKKYLEPYLKAMVSDYTFKGEVYLNVMANNVKEMDKRYKENQIKIIF